MQRTITRCLTSIFQLPLNIYGYLPFTLFKMITPKLLVASVSKSWEIRWYFVGNARDKALNNYHSGVWFGWLHDYTITRTNELQSPFSLLYFFSFVHFLVDKALYSKSIIRWLRNWLAYLYAVLTNFNLYPPTYAKPQISAGRVPYFVILVSLFARAVAEKYSQSEHQKSCTKFF